MNVRSHTRRGVQQDLARYLRTSRRGGFTLLEVILAVAILAIAMQGVIELAHIGARGDVASQLQIDAAERAQTLFAELLSGAIPVHPTTDARFSNGPDWRWTLNIRELDANLTQWELTIAFEPAGTRILAERFTRLIRSERLSDLPSIPTGGRR